ncbi:MAG TPA: hypothetical protein VE709_09905, partial [Pseudonocardiaceae bacterium]|nr:hypothetical protein [Pseudonocardiaceae bacterium]
MHAAARPAITNANNPPDQIHGADRVADTGTVVHCQTCELASGREELRDGAEQARLRAGSVPGSTSG